MTETVLMMMYGSPSAKYSVGMNTQGLREAAGCLFIYRKDYQISRQTFQKKMLGYGDSPESTASPVIMGQSPKDFQGMDGRGLKVE